MSVTTADRLRELLSCGQTQSAGWSPPICFDLTTEADQMDLVAMLESGHIATVVDKVSIIASDLFEVLNPQQKSDWTRKSQFVEDILSKGIGYGKWFLFPWSKALIRYPDESTHRALRTSRNRDLVTAREQESLFNSTVAIFGLSVGSSVVDRLLSYGIGGKLIIADMDTIEPSNLNRIDTTFSEVGSKKIDRMARKISEVDPYIRQVHLPDGVSEENLRTLLAGHRPNILVDEIDDLRLKVVIRLLGKQARIPVVMATDVGDKSIIDVERNDLEDVRLFNGRLGSDEIDLLLHGELSVDARTKMMMKIVGLRNVTPRLIDSATKVGKTLPGLPQLGATAAIGGGLASIVIREILLGRKMSSGRYVFSPKRTLRLASQTRALESFRIIRLARG